VLAVGLVPSGADIDAEVFSGDESLELCVCTVSETIANAEGVFRAGFHE